MSPRFVGMSLALLLVLVAVGCAGIGDAWSDASGTDGGVTPAPDTAAPDPGPADPGSPSSPDPGAIEPDFGPAETLDPGEPPPPDVEDVEDVEDVPDVGPDAPDEAPDVDVDAADEQGDSGDAGPDCDDDDPCTEDFWDGEECQNDYAYGICCDANPHCDDGDVCTADVCVDGLCTHAPSCCSEDAECADSDAICTTELCLEGLCVAQPTAAEGCCAPSLFEENFDDLEPGDVILQNTDDDTGWHVTGAQAKSPPGALWYGNPETASYDNGVANNGTVTLPVLTLPGGVEASLSLDLFLAVEYGTAYDQLRIEVAEVGTTQTIVVWDKAKAFVYNGWFSVQVDLTAFAGKQLLVVIVFDTVDELDNGTQGVFIDNLSVTSSCVGRQCLLDIDCKDGLGATLDKCVGADPDTSTLGWCAYKPNSKYCTSYQDCDDGLPCTYNSCSQNECIYIQNDNCCLADEDCDDGDPCTIDDCAGAWSTNGGYCQMITVPTCCKTDGDCNDGDPCTADSCAGFGKECVNVEIPSCCLEHEDCSDSDPCTEDLCVAGLCKNATVCCASEAACNDGDDLCTADTCADGLCSYQFIDETGCCKVSTSFANFTGPALQGYTVITDTTPFDGVTWTAASEPSLSVGGALHYGVPGGTYDSGFANSATVESPPFFVPVATINRLSFWLHLDNEFANGVGSIAWDRLAVHAVRADKPTDPMLLWDSADGAPQWWISGEGGAPEGPQWTLIDGLDLGPLKGRTIKLRFTFDTVDTDANAFGGVTIDDISAIATCK